MRKTIEEKISKINKLSNYQNRIKKLQKLQELQKCLNSIYAQDLICFNDFHYLMIDIVENINLCNEVINKKCEHNKKIETLFHTLSSLKMEDEVIINDILHDKDEVTYCGIIKNVPFEALNKCYVRHIKYVNKNECYVITVGYKK